MQQWYTGGRMPRQCTICTHPDRADIDAALVAGGSIRDVARRFGAGKGAVERHRDHFRAALVAAAERREDASLERVLEGIEYAEDALKWAIEEKIKAGKGDEWKHLPRMTAQLASSTRLRAEVTGVLGGGKNKGSGAPQVILVLPQQLPAGARDADLSIPGIQDARGKLLPEYLARIDREDRARRLGLPVAELEEAEALEAELEGDGGAEPGGG